MADRKAVVKNADMSEGKNNILRELTWKIDMQQDAIDIATQALEKFNIEKDIAAFIKKEFDKKYNPTWHCIVGKKTVGKLIFVQEETSAPILLMRQSISSISIWDKQQFYCSNLDESAAMVYKPVNYNKIIKLFIF